MEEVKTNKDSYYYGLSLIKKDLESCINDEYYETIVEYFTYSLECINNEVLSYEAQHLADEAFYHKKSKELLKLYNRLTITMMAVSERMPLSTKIIRRLKKRKRA